MEVKDKWQMRRRERRRRVNESSETKTLQGKEGKEYLK